MFFCVYLQVSFSLPIGAFSVEKKCSRDQFGCHQTKISKSELLRGKIYVFCALEVGQKPWTLAFQVISDTRAKKKAAKGPSDFPPESRPPSEPNISRKWGFRLWRFLLKSFLTMMLHDSSWSRDTIANLGWLWSALDRLVRVSEAFLRRGPFCLLLRRWNHQ